MLPRHQSYLRSVFAAVVLLSIIGAFAGFAVALAIVAGCPNLTGFEAAVSLVGGTVIGWLVSLGVTCCAFL